MTILDQPHRVLFSESQIEERVSALGEAISRDYQGEELLLIGILRGTVFFMADLMRAITVPHRIDFMAISSYGQTSETSGVVRIMKDLEESIEGRNVLLVEDIIDTGLTLHYILRQLRAQRPASLEVCTLLDKRAHRLVEIFPKYVGFTIEDQFVIGYGLDEYQLYRNLPYIAVLT